MENDDRQLIMRCRQGQEQAYYQLLSKYEGYIYSLCYRLVGHREDALDLSQEAMLKLVTNLNSYQVNRPFKPWLRQVVINVCLNHLRSKNSLEPLPLEYSESGGLTLADTLMAASEDEPMAHLEWLETQEALTRSLKQLPAHLRIVLIMRHQEDMSYQEIASILSLPQGTVKTHLYRGRNLLRKVLNEVYGWEE